MDDVDDIPVLVEASPTSPEDAPEGLSIPNLSLVNPTDSSQAPHTVPLTIICGFLGAGKSTLVRRILTERHGYRIAVIMNEFGDTADIEAKTINVSSPDESAQQSEEFLELANGCLCCSIKDTGIAAIEKLMKRKGAFDHILLETTGLADPGPIASIFWQNEEFTQGLGRDIHLDGVVCVVDAVFGRQQMEEDHAADGIGESLRQIAAADVILLNKVDLVPSPEADATEAVIHGVNPAASVYKTIRGEIDLKHIMGVDAYASRQILDVSGLAKSPQECGHDHHDHGDHHHHHHHHAKPPTHYELRGISSLQIDCPRLSLEQMDLLDEWVRSILWEKQLPDRPAGDNDGIEVLRCKGLFVTTAGELHVLQGVRNLYEISKVEDEALGLPDAGKLVFIGKGLHEHVRTSLQKQLKIV